MGELVGTFLGVFILHAVWEFVLFKRICNDPVTGKLLSTLAAYLTAVIVYGFGSAVGGSWNPAGAALYLPAALVIAIYSVVRGRNLRDQQPTDDLENTFR